jgi:PEGA domain
MKTAAISLCALLISAQTSLPTQAVAVAASAPPTSAPAASIPKPNTLLDGTPIKLRLGRTISSADAKTGDEVDFEAVEDVTVNGTVVIGKGALALATVTEAEHKRSMGRAGKLNVNIDSVRLVDQEKAALRATEGGKGGGHVGAMTGAIVATSIVFFPAAPLFLFVHGKDITIPKGTEITAYVDGDMTLNMARFTPNAGAAPIAALSRVNVDASVPNCDIEVDGVFAGNTPSQLSMTPGKHDISIQKKGYIPWSRTVMVSGSAIHIEAELSNAAPTAAAGTQP